MHGSYTRHILNQQSADRQNAAAAALRQAADAAASLRSELAALAATPKNGDFATLLNHTPTPGATS